MTRDWKSGWNTAEKKSKQKGMKEQVLHYNIIDSWMDLMEICLFFSPCCPMCVRTFLLYYSQPYRIFVCPCIPPKNNKEFEMRVVVFPFLPILRGTFEPTPKGFIVAIITVAFFIIFLLSFFPRCIARLLLFVLPTDPSSHRHPLFSSSVSN